VPAKLKTGVGASNRPVAWQKLSGVLQNVAGPVQTTAKVHALSPRFFTDDFSPGDGAPSGQHCGSTAAVVCSRRCWRSGASFDVPAKLKTGVGASNPTGGLAKFFSGPQVAAGPVGLTAKVHAPPTIFLCFAKETLLSVRTVPRGPSLERDSALQEIVLPGWVRASMCPRS